MKPRFKLGAITGLAAALLTTTAAAAVTAGEDSNDRGAPLEAATDAYHKAFPGISGAAAQAAAAGQETRRKLYADLSADAQATGGFWFDPATGEVNVNVTGRASGDNAARIGSRLGLRVRTHQVARSFRSLEKLADRLREGDTALGKAAHGQVGIDVTTNQVVVALPAAQVDSFTRAELPAGVTVIADPKIKTEADYGCTSRAACDWTVRAGSMIWPGSAGNNACSVGFTARNSSNTRYVYTAGHCSNGNGVTWGTGSTPIGPMQASVDSGTLDASIIRVTNPWFTGDAGGEIYNDSVAGKTVPLNGVAPYLSYIVQGETVCLSANFTSPNGPSYCGVIGTNSDPTVRGLVRVNQLDACPGDSGGGWYWLTSTGRRIGYGIHSRSDTGCHGSAGGTHSWFGALPTVKNSWTPSLNVEVRP